MVPVETAIGVEVFVILGVGLGVVNGFTNSMSDVEVLPVSGIISVRVLSETLAISIVGLEELCLTSPHSPVEKINTIPSPMDKEKNNITNTIFRFRFILFNITLFR